MDEPKMGEVWTFLDSEATVSDGVEGVCKGWVNGPSIYEDGVLLLVPVWAERDNGREPTTIYVGADNLIGKVGE